jgi:hypothetical protein
MAIASVQVKGSQQTSAGNITVTLDANVTAGNTVAVLVTSYSDADVTYIVTDQSDNNALTAITTQAWDASFGIKSATYRLVNAPSGISGIKFATSAGTTLFSVAIQEFSGGHTSTPTSGTPTSNVGTGTTADSGNTTPGVNDCLLFGGGPEGSYVEAEVCTHTLGSGYTVVFNGAAGASIGILCEYLIQGTAAADSADWTLSRSTKWWSHVVAFQPAGGGGGGGEGGKTSLSLTGVG